MIMRSLDTISATKQTHRLLLYGAPGSGKTWAVGQLATTHKLYYFSLENGHQTLLNPECVPVEARKNIVVISMLDTPENPIACTSLDTFFKQRNGVFCDAHGRISCPLCMKEFGNEFSKHSTTIDLASLTPNDIIVIDSLTQWEASISFYLNRTTEGEIPRSGDSVFDYYRKLALYLNRSLSRIQILKECSIIVITHEVDAESVTGNDKIVPAGGSKNFSRQNARYFDGVYHMYKQNKVHKMASSSTYSTTIDTKDRSGFDASKFKSPALGLKALFNPEKYDEILALDARTK